MFLTLVLLAAAPDPSTLLMQNAAGRLTPGCVGSDCQPVKRRSPYRIVVDDETHAPTSKDRAFADDGTYCQVVGDKYCTSNGAKIFSTAIDK